MSFLTACIADNYFSAAAAAAVFLAGCRVAAIAFRRRRWRLRFNRLWASSQRIADDRGSRKALSIFVLNAARKYGRWKVQLSIPAWCKSDAERVLRCERDSEFGSHLNCFNSAKASSTFRGVRELSDDKTAESNFSNSRNFQCLIRTSPPAIRSLLFCHFTIHPPFSSRSRKPFHKENYISPLIIMIRSLLNAKSLSMFECIWL